MTGSEIHLFGATTPVGEAFRLACQFDDAISKVFAYSRSPSDGDTEYHAVDLNKPSTFAPAGDLNHAKVWVSFAPIWSLSSFLARLSSDYPNLLLNMRGLIACSSSSIVTKRFSVNNHDKELFSRLERAERLILDTCNHLGVPCRILRPTLVYGQAGGYSDRNLSRLLQLLRSFPVLPIPAITGLRQPIHASQLASVALHFANQLVASGSDMPLACRIPLGGDSVLSYAEMVRTLQQAQACKDPARRCRLLPIPNRLFFLLASPLLLWSPKAFEAVLRMGANLSGFTPVHHILGSEPQPFPVLPLS